MNLKLHWGYFLINEVGQSFYQLDQLTFPKNVFWSVNFALSFCQNLLRPKVNFMACLNVDISTKKLKTL